MYRPVGASSDMNSRPMFSSYLEKYRTIIFDCDGVILNSNKVKSDAFYASVIEYGKEYADELVSYHIANGGISRYAKFDYFLKTILNHPTPETELDKLLNNYAREVRQGLLSCEIASGIADLRSATPDAKWFIASGGDQSELREIFTLRNLSEYFDGGIFGSPDNKITIFSRELANNSAYSPIVFLGDSLYDYKCSCEFELDFVFLHKWTEFKEWNDFFSDKAVTIVSSLQDLSNNKVTT